MERFNTGGRYYESVYYITLIYNYGQSSIDDGIKKLDSVLKMSEKICGPFGLSVLQNDGYMNESANFLSWLINHHDFKVPLVEDPIYKVVGNSERIFGYDISLIRKLMMLKINIVFLIPFVHSLQRLSLVRLILFYQFLAN
ncbi:Conjugal transfer protein TraE [Escherichia coli]|uniref:Conjugal transfer protein TraE n=1 Tax=Escherichia coli TaxID=562 RepID=A0A377BCF5_ECOLX|nr:Conjugal transfer protein TraE [Escherichia coli]